MGNRLLFIFLLSSVVSFAQPDSSAIKEYLRGNTAPLDLKDPKAPALFDPAFYQNQVFLFGETHGSAEPHLVDLFLFKQLYRDAGVRSYIAELDDSKAWMLNSYLADGKEEWLKKVFASWVRDTAQWASKENMDKYRELRSFYQSLPASEKFRIIGVDDTQDYSLLKEHLGWILSQSKPVKGAVYVDSLKGMVDTASADNRRVLGEFARRFLGQLEGNMRLAGTTGKNHKQFLHLLRSLSFVEKGVTRDSIMYRNFTDYVEVNDIGEEKFYGFLGYFHCLSASFNKVPTFASLLDETSERFSGKVQTLLMQTVASKSMLPLVSQLRMMMPKVVIQKAQAESPAYADGRYIPYELSNDNPMMMIKGTQYLKPLVKPGGLLLVKLDGPESPYSRSKLSAEIGGFQSVKFSSADAVTTDAMDYIILFHNAHACTPLPK